MNNKILTTISGSLPKPNWLAEPEKLWSPWLLEGEELKEGKRKAIKIAVNNQINSGLSIIGDGEQTRQHFVTTFIEHLSGVDFNNKKIVRIRNRYDASVPVVFGDIVRERSVFVEDAKYLRSLTKLPIKYTLPGPMTMVDTLYDDYYQSREKFAEKLAEVLNHEAQELVDAGVDYIQCDEPAVNVFFDEVKDWGIKILEKAANNLKAKTIVHICYGYGIEANINWKNSLGNEWRQYENVFPLLAKSKIDQISLECQNSKVPMDLIELLKGKKILVGAIDVATKKIETPEQVANILRNATKFAEPKNILGCTNCGLVTFSQEVANAKMKSLALGAQIVNNEFGLE
jgi:5-methyltetrahydropteroyltriglutamate--homocysteine methyltransferase